MIEVMAGRIVSPELIGREEQLELIARALQDAQRGRARTILVGGEAGIGLGFVVSALEIEDQRHQGLGDEAAAIKSEMAALVGAAAEGVQLSLFAARAHDALARA